jgi:hypothetical protein
MTPSNIYWHRGPEVMKYRASATFVKRAYIFISKVIENSLPIPYILDD